MKFINEFGEEVSKDQLLGYVTRVRKLIDSQIDQLWFDCGWIVHGREPQYKAVRQQDIDWIRHSEERAAVTVTNLLLECHIAEFEKRLRTIETESQ